MIPRNPSEAPAIGRQPRRGEEVVSAGDDVAWCGVGLHQVDRDDGIDSLTCVSVILAHADPAMAPMVDDAVCESAVAIAREWRWRQRCRLTLARAKPIQPAIREIRKIEDAKRDCPRATTIFVHAGAHVEWLWHEVRRTCAGPTRSHYDVATLLLRSCLQPVNSLLIKAHFRQADSLRNDEIRRDWRLPGSAGRRLWIHRHRCSVLQAVLFRRGSTPVGRHQLTPQGSMLISKRVRCSPFGRRL